ncbi:MAG TPA: DUF2459 domain-containing protein [Acetobacteraceae bacterium]|nr:DUF2459 domain-containing protein [Acetobacteraceae bacterium]
MPRSPAASEAAPQAPATDTVYVVGRGWHTDIGLPTAETGPSLAGPASDFPGARYLVFGFGEKGYLLSRDRGLFEMLTALLPSPGMILVTGLRDSPVAAFGAEHVVALRVTPEERQRVTRFIAAYLARDGAGRAQPIGDGPYSGSLFYASDGTYDGFHTCNTWTAEALRQAGLPVTATGILFADQVMAEARRAAAAQDEEPARRTAER